MTILRLSLAAIACLLLSAHFLRMGRIGLLIACLLVAALLFVKKPWAARTVQVALVLGTLEWLRTLYVRTEMRRATGEPYLRLVIILGSVAAFTALTTLVFGNAKVRARFGLPG